MSSAVVLLFGDQLSSKSPALRRLYALSQQKPSLRAFLDNATKIVRSQLEDLLPLERTAFGDFVDILELVDHYESAAHLNEAVGTVLTTIIQVADLLLLSEVQPDVLGISTKSHQIGVCIGLLAAAVATTARHATDVVTFGLECVAVAFRLGIELWRRTRLVDESPESWGCTIIGMSPDEVHQHLEAFNTSFTPLRRAYVGVQANTWSTIFAPPSTMHLLCGSPEFAQTPQARLPSAMAVHASHLPPLDVKRIVGNCPVLDADVLSCAVLSTSTTTPFMASSLKTLLHLIIEDIAQKPLFLETTVKNLAALLEAGDITNAQLIPVGPTHSVSIVYRELQRRVKTIEIGQTSFAYAGRENTESGHIAIVGMSGRFPDSDSTSELWDLLQSGRSTHTRIPKSRFDISDFFDPSLETPCAVATEVGCFLRNPGEFDNLLFNISPREAMQMDPIQRLMLMTTYEALQMAGYSRNTTLSTLQAHIGTFLGQSAEEWKAINDQEGVDTHYVPGTMRSFVAGRLNHYFHWGGGITSVDTACSASACAVHLACKALLSKEVDTAIAGGGHVCVGPALYSGLSKGGFLSTGPCRTFNDAADGYCRGEAVGVLVLKRLEDALRENDNVLAVIRGSERNSNAGTGSITYPSSDAQAALYRRILHDSGVEPNEISFVEMHGTGTQAGDAAEMSALLGTFGRNRPSEFPLYVGAIKAAIGHSEGAAGVSSLIKAILMLQKRAMPPQPGWPFKVNQKFASSLDEANVKISDGKSPLKGAETGNGLCKILVNSFDAAGGNVSLLLEETAAVVRSPKSLDEREKSYHVVVATGRTPKTLAANVSRLRAYLCSHPDTDMTSLSYTTTARRIHELHRSGFVCRSVTELLAQLDASEVTQHTPNRHTEPQLAYTFTGQGSAYTSMGLELYQSASQFRMIVDTLQDLCDSQGLARFLDIIRGTQEVSNAAATQVQLSIVALEIALAQYLQSLGLQPSIVLGHSLGEYAALAIAGVLSVADALFLVHTRAALIEEHCTAHVYSMLAVSMSVASTEDLLEQVIIDCPSCEIACVNAPSMTVVSGKTDDLKSVQSLLKNRDLQTTLLTVPFGFHSSQLDPVLDAFEKAATKVHFAQPAIPVASTLLGEVVQCGGIFDASYLRRQMREPVNFLGAVQAGKESGFFKSGSIAIEIGPHPVCTALLKKSCPNVQMVSLPTLRKGEDSGQSMSKLVAGVFVAGMSLKLRELYKDSASSVRLLNLPPYAFDSKTYWTPYKTPKAVERIISQDSASTQQPAAGVQLPYTCLQTLDNMASSVDGGITAAFSSKTAQQDLFNAIRGHVVGGVSLCPASVFIEMAHTAASHILQTTGIMGNSFHLEVVELQMTHALLVRERDPEQVVQVLCSLDANSTAFSVKFTSTTRDSSSTHGTCSVLFFKEPPSELQQWKHMGKLVRNRVQSLIESAKDGPVHRMSRSLFYQLFGSLVEYHEPYQSVKEAYVSPDFQDAAAICSLGRNTASGVYTCDPFAMDGIVHLSGFILNADLAKDKDIIHVSNRIGSFQLLRELFPQKRYICYASIREQSAKGRTVCDVYVYDEDDLVAACTEICFQRMTKATFSSLIVGQPKPATRSSTVPVPVAHAKLQRSRQDFPLSSAKECPTSADILMQAISNKTGVSLSELGPSVSFSDIGVDSQMSIAITSEFKKRSGIDLPASFFICHSTVQEARAELMASNSVNPALDPPPLRPEQRDTMKGGSDVAIETRPAQAGRLSQVLLQIVADEVGIPADDFADIGDWESAGIDSMMTIKLVSQFKQKTGVELPATFFQTYPTLADVEIELDGDSQSASSGSISDTSVTRILTPPPREYESRAVLILGSSNSTQRPVFMVADGHGSADAFVHLSPLPRGQRLYALESPFVDDPEAFTLTIPQLAQAYIKTIRKIQPKGPYIIGGRSAGAAYAYEVAFQMSKQNETISGLILIDMRVPRAVPHAVHIDAKFVAKAWQVIVEHTNVLLDEGDLCHAAATIRALHSYDPTPLPENRRPLLKYVIWAALGVNENRTQTLHDKSVSRPAAMGPPLLDRDLATVSLEEFEEEFKSWFWGERKDFGANGWDVLLGDDVRTKTVDGDHFCMVSPPWVKSLSAALVDAVTEIENAS